MYIALNLWLFFVPYTVISFWLSFDRSRFAGEGNEISNLMEMVHLTQEYLALALMSFPLDRNALLDVCKFSKD